MDKMDKKEKIEKMNKIEKIVHNQLPKKDFPQASSQLSDDEKLSSVKIEHSVSEKSDHQEEEDENDEELVEIESSEAAE
jgi:hypothetical protein